MNFASDNVYGVHPSIMAALSDANRGTYRSYGHDTITAEAEKALAKVFGCDLRAFFVISGTAANSLALASTTPPHGAVLCHQEAHIATDECNAPEMFTGGAKIMGLPGASGKLNASTVDKALKGFIRGEHEPRPATLSITNATELGTIYSPAEVKALSDVIRPRGMKFHMDGARFANALVSTNASAAELTWKSGVDVLSFGATKNGALMLEAVVFFDVKLADEFLYRRKRSGQLVSKGRYLGAQMKAYLENDLWLSNARTANGLASKLAKGLDEIPSVRIAHKVQANEVFAVMPQSLFNALREKGANFYDWAPDSIEGGIKDDDVLTRFVLSFETPAQHVEEFIATAGKLARK